MGDTESDETAEPGAARPREVAALYRVIAAHAPVETASMHVLGETVELSRADAAGHTRERDTLRIAIVDRWASEHHARLVRSVGRWQIEDRGSKNGTLVNSRPVTAATYLVHGDVIEIGRTFFVFGAAPGDVTDGAPRELLPGVTTLAPALIHSLSQLAILARGTMPLSIHGPTGTGKEVVARGVHAASGRSGPFVPVNCGAIPRELVESVLFGHRRGAFSGALDDQPGLVRSAHGGTLFLDEIGDLPLAAQAALLRVLQDHEVMPVGGTRPISVDLRVVAATHRDLGAMVDAGAFRADLLHRLAGYTLVLPALAERRVDLGELVRSIFGKLGRAPALHPRVVRALFAYPWPGNIRELELVLRSAVELATGGTIEIEHLPPAIAAYGGPRTEPLADDERERVVELLREHRGNVRAIARATGKDPVQVRRWLRRHGLVADEYR